MTILQAFADRRFFDSGGLTQSLSQACALSLLSTKLRAFCCRAIDGAALVSVPFLPALPSPLALPFLAAGPSPPDVAPGAAARFALVTDRVDSAEAS